MQHHETVVSINTSRLLRWFAVAIAVVVLLGVVRSGLELAWGMKKNGFAAFLSLDAEGSVPTWLEVLLFAAVSVAMLLAGRLDKAAGLATARAWRILGWVFLYLSLDELISVHEFFDRVEVLLPLGGYFYYGWVVVGIAAVGVVAVGFLPFVRRLPRSTAVQLIIAGIVFVTGALGMEMIGGKLFEEQQHGVATSAVAMAEETLELVGLWLTLRAVLGHVGKHAVLLRLTAGPGQAVDASHAS